SLVCFFFSSRRRHTRSTRDWSSDVCSSDLGRSLDFRFRLNRRATRSGVTLEVVCHAFSQAASCTPRVRGVTQPRGERQVAFLYCLLRDHAYLERLFSPGDMACYKVD